MRTQNKNVSCVYMFVCTHVCMYVACTHSVVVWMPAFSSYLVSSQMYMYVDICMYIYLYARDVHKVEKLTKTYVHMYVRMLLTHMYALRFQLGHCKISILSHASHFICIHPCTHMYMLMRICLCVRLYVCILKVVRVCQFNLLLAGKKL